MECTVVNVKGYFKEVVMSQYNNVIDKYWVDFLVSNKGDYTTERARHAHFWWWFYNTLCEESRTLAEQKWKDAQDVSSK